MKQALAVVVVLFVCSLVVAQSSPAPAPARPPAPAINLPGGFAPPAGLFDQWWKDPNVARELGLTEAQKKQLDDNALQQRLALIDSGADALKSFTRLSALLDADQFNEPAFNQQLSDLGTAVGRVVQTFGQMAMTTRRVLSAEQWHKLQILRPHLTAPHPPAPAAPPHRP